MAGVVAGDHACVVSGVGGVDVPVEFRDGVGDAAGVAVGARVAQVRGVAARDAVFGVGVLFLSVSDQHVRPRPVLAELRGGSVRHGGRRVDGGLRVDARHGHGHPLGPVDLPRGRRPEPGADLHGDVRVVPQKSDDPRQPLRLPAPGRLLALGSAPLQHGHRQRPHCAFNGRLRGPRLLLRRRRRPGAVRSLGRPRLHAPVPHRPLPRWRWWPRDQGRRRLHGHGTARTQQQRTQQQERPLPAQAQHRWRRSSLGRRPAPRRRLIE
mmetsp:Transcript_12446/g.40732  ORF Transcript_12446/g.40732 Transcript_12446/m.40732 type:complete len:266 (-) Transcript_12446:55-852(-)